MREIKNGRVIVKMAQLMHVSRCLQESVQRATQ